MLIPTVVSLLHLRGREVAAVLVAAAMVEPVDPFRGGELGLVKAAPRVGFLDQLGRVEAVDRLGQGVVERRADRAGRRPDASGGETFTAASETYGDAVVVVLDRPGQLGPSVAGASPA